MCANLPYSNNKFLCSMNANLRAQGGRTDKSPRKGTIVCRCVGKRGENALLCDLVRCLRLQTSGRMMEVNTGRARTSIRRATASSTSNLSSRSPSFSSPFELLYSCAQQKHSISRAKRSRHGCDMISRFVSSCSTKMAFVVTRDLL